ncbi:hypothetical protein A6V39_02295 [Candidatus Mycoplasma haematobovis]|uniref:Uncharacterized protein n=1 Tax=Candidatus Mycoplasma haematobovis TaxID=432608 RepID=A0A1A9QCE7_9MOLU|nr:hypothetical protein [Candidatus Mycoplasma haematobovis]OAL10252.1 hypothetical protein A6V39_02295 [Candidatus Mycoplasma haematobovis]
MVNIIEKPDKLKQFTDRNTPIEERVSKLIHTMGGLNPNPELQKILDSINSEEFLLINAYRELSLEIKETLHKTLLSINSLKAEALKIDISLVKEGERLNKYCTIYSNLPPLKESQNVEEYQFFKKSYERTNEIAQELAQLNVKAMNLLEVQKILDSSFSLEIIEFRSLVEKLHGVIKSFGVMKTPELIEEYRQKFNHLGELHSLVEDKNKEFEELRKHLEIAHLDTKIVNKYDKFATDYLTDSNSVEVSKNLFVYKK